MPYYKITVTDVRRAKKTGIRYDDIADIDEYLEKARLQAIAILGDEFSTIDVVMLSSSSMEIVEHQKQLIRFRLRNPLAIPGAPVIVQWEQVIKKNWLKP
jgi:hypothetical protein